MSAVSVIKTNTGAATPADFASEQAVLGALMIGAPWSSVELLTPGDFSRPDHALIFAAMTQLAGGGVTLDIITVSERLSSIAKLDDAGGLAYLSQLARETATAHNCVAYARAVRTRSDARAARAAISASLVDAEGLDGAGILQALDRRLDPVRERVAWRGEIALNGFTSENILAPIEPERHALPGIPLEAYSLIAGGLASFKTTLLIYLLAWKATGWDILGLDAHGCGCDPGACVLITYEDTDNRIFAKLQRVIQHGYSEICSRFGERDAQRFVELAAANLRRISLSGKHGCGIVHRTGGEVEPNRVFLDLIEREVSVFAPQGALIGLDPLRLGIAGSQNDDDGADVVVRTLNQIATMVPGSAVVACSHTTKAGAQEPGTGYAGAAYATSGSALFSQHARSNFLMARLRSAEIREQFDDVTPLEAAKQLVVRLTHGRLSHGVERGDVHLLMRGGVLHRLEPKSDTSAAEFMRRAGESLIAGIERLKSASIKVSMAAIESDSAISEAIGSRSKIRTAVTLLMQNGYLKITGKTRDKAITVTDAGKAFISGEKRRESTAGGAA